MSHSARSHSSHSDVPGSKTGNLPSGGHTIVVIRDDRDVHSAAALRCCAQFNQHQGLKLGPCFWQLVHHSLLFGPRDFAECLIWAD